MLSQTIDNPETKVYCISHDLSVEEQSTVEEARKHRPKPILIVVKSNIGKTQSFYNTDYFAHSAYEFITENKKQNYYEEEGWKLIRMIERKDRSRASFITIADPTGVENTLKNEDLHSHWNIFFQIEGICNTMRLMRFLAPYTSWAQFEEVNGPLLPALKRVDLSQSYFDQNSLNSKRRAYLWKLGIFLADNHRKMTFSDLRSHLKQNKLKVTHAEDEFKGNKVQEIVQDVEHWLGMQMGLPTEAIMFARVFVA